MQQVQEAAQVAAMLVVVVVVPLKLQRHSSTRRLRRQSRAQSLRRQLQHARRMPLTALWRLQGQVWHVWWRS